MSMLYYSVPYMGNVTWIICNMYDLSYLRRRKMPWRERKESDTRVRDWVVPLDRGARKVLLTELTLPRAQRRCRGKTRRTQETASAKPHGGNGLAMLKDYQETHGVQKISLMSF